MATFRVAQSIGVSVDDCEQFVAAQHPSLVRAAFLLTGEPASAQDLVQETLIKVIDKWKRVRSASSPEAYARKIMLNEFLRSRRRRWYAEVPHGVLPEPTVTGGYDRVDDQDRIRRVLMALPPRQRSAIVMRHYEDRSEAETAELLGCTVGTVKSLTSRGMQALRAHAADQAPASSEPGGRE